MIFIALLLLMARGYPDFSVCGKQFTDAKGEQRWCIREPGHGGSHA